MSLATMEDIKEKVNKLFVGAPKHAPLQPRREQLPTGMTLGDNHLKIEKDGSWTLGRHTVGANIAP